MFMFKIKCLKLKKKKKWTNSYLMRAWENYLSRPLMVILKVHNSPIFAFILELLPSVDNIALIVKRNAAQCLWWNNFNSLFFSMYIYEYLEYHLEMFWLPISCSFICSHHLCLLFLWKYGWQNGSQGCMALKHRKLTDFL